MADSSCFLCPGKASIYTSAVDGSGYPASGTGSWLMLPHTVSWEFTADVEEPTEIRTSNTDNKKVKPCQGATSFESSVNSALCDEDWLYAYILTDETDPSEGGDLWFYLCWDNVAPTITASTHPSAAAVYANTGVWVRGTVQAPGIEFDNDSSDPVVQEWTIKITNGPWLPGAEMQTPPFGISAL